MDNEKLSETKLPPNYASHSREPIIVILLGSYDPETKKLLYKLKEEIVKIYAGSSYHVYAFLLEKLKVYNLSGGGTLFIEQFNQRSFTAYYLTPEGILKDVMEFRGELKEVLEDIEEFFDIKIVWEARPLNKIRRLIDYPNSIIILLREKELTRGGEYIELAYLTSRIRVEEIPVRVWFFKREGIPISTMVKELLTDYKIQFRTYKTEDELIDEVLRVIYYFIKFRERDPK